MFVVTEKVIDEARFKVKEGKKSKTKSLQALEQWLLQARSLYIHAYQRRLSVSPPGLRMQR